MIWSYFQFWFNTQELVTTIYCSSHSFPLCTRWISWWIFHRCVLRTRFFAIFLNVEIEYFPTEIEFIVTVACITAFFFASIHWAIFLLLLLLLLPLVQLECIFQWKLRCEMWVCVHAVCCCCCCCWVHFVENRWLISRIQLIRLNKMVIVHDEREFCCFQLIVFSWLSNKLY